MRSKLLLTYASRSGLRVSMDASDEDLRIAAETLLIVLGRESLDRVIAAAETIKSDRAREAAAFWQLMGEDENDAPGGDPPWPSTDPGVIL